ncbi:MAG: regulatory protein GemA [Sedimentisphaerales bacterium]|nr:regulatory protein GemA [Sedimentisphaerales bacterium]
MLNKPQIILVQIACKQAGLRSAKFDGRYRMLLSQYKQPNGSPVKSCKQLNNMQLDDLLAICESHGWRQPGKTEDYYRQKSAAQSCYAGYAQQEAIRHLAGDLGWNELQLAGMLKRMTAGEVGNIVMLKPRQAFQAIEAMKAIFSRKCGRQFSNLKQIQDEVSATVEKPTPSDGETMSGIPDEEMEVKDGQQTCQV